MKKSLSIIITSMFLSLTANAEGLIGIKVGYGELEGTKKAYTAGSNDYAASSSDANSEYAAIFAEYKIENSPISIGLEYIPIEASIGVDTSGADSSAELSDYTTLYALAEFHETANGASLYGKIGYSRADIGNVKANSDGTTINSFDDELTGVMAGIGVQSDSIFADLGLTSRLELTYTEFDEIKVNTTSNGSAAVDKKGDGNLTQLSISIAKKF